MRGAESQKIRIRKKDIGTVVLITKGPLHPNDGIGNQGCLRRHGSVWRKRKGWNRSRHQARVLEELKFEICEVERVAEAVILKGMELRL
jgi:hypothetical protein